MKNYIRNGDFRVLLDGNNPGLIADAAAKGYTITKNAKNEVTQLAGLNTAPAYGIVPGWGHGPGGGANSTIQLIDRAPSEIRVPSQPMRWLWIGWNTALDPVHGADGSGWVPHGYPFRYTFLEHFMFRPHELLGHYFAYEFYAITGAGNSMPVLPVLWTNYDDNQFCLHDLHENITVDANGPVAAPGAGDRGGFHRFYGIFKIPKIPAGQSLNNDKFYIGFGLDSTTPNPCPILLGGFKGFRVPDMCDSVEARHIAEEKLILTDWYTQ